MEQGILDNFAEEKIEESLEKVKKEAVEKMKEINSNFSSNVKPENKIYGVTEKLRYDGILERITKKPDNLITKSYYKGDVLLNVKDRIDNDTWKITFYDDNGTDYFQKIMKRTDTGSLRKASEELLPNKTIVRDNFVSKTDLLGRLISTKVYDLTLNTNPRGNINLDKEGKGYLPDDQKGHGVPHIFNGKGTIENIYPQIDEANQGKIKQVENFARKFKEEGHKVDYEMRANYGDEVNPNRPTSFEPIITVDGEKIKLSPELSKIYNQKNLTTVDKLKTTVNEKIDSIKITADNSIQKLKPTINNAHSFGKEGAMLSGGLTFISSTTEDLMLVFEGDMQPDDMVYDVVKDSAVAGGFGYLSAFAESSISTAMRSSSNTMISSLSKIGIPAMMIDFGIQSYDSITNYASGTIDEFELMYDLGENSTTTIAAFEGAQIGASLGSAGGPVTSVAGGMIGGMVGYCLASEAYAAAVDAGSEGAEIIGEKANELGKLCIDTATEYVPEFANDIATSITNFANDFELPFAF